MNSDVAAFTEESEPPQSGALAPVLARPSGLRQLRRIAHALVTRLPWPWQEHLYFLDTFGRLPNLRAPACFNEKVLYRKSVHGDHQAYRKLTDKIAVRDHVAARIGEQYLIPLLHRTTDPATLLTLPRWKHTVIKPNHGAGMVEVLLDEPDLRRKQALLEDCARWLRTDYSKVAREIHYRGIPPCILVEQYIGDGAQAPIDYKFHMFRQPDGGFRYVLQVIYNRLQPPLAMTFFVDNLAEPFHRIRDAGQSPPCAPALLRKALDLSKVLAVDFDYVRVDWYIQDGQIYFGELTFTPGAGMVTGLDRGLDRIMGQMWVQPRAPAKPSFLPPLPKPITAAAPEPKPRAPAWALRRLGTGRPTRARYVQRSQRFSGMQGVLAAQATGRIAVASQQGMESGGPA